MNALKKISFFVILSLALSFVFKAKAQDVHYNVGYFTYDDDQFNLALADDGATTPAYEIISSNTLSDVVSLDLFNSIYDPATQTYIAPTGITIDDGSATNFSGGATTASFQLTAGQWVKLKVAFPTWYGYIYQYVNFYRNL